MTSLNNATIVCWVLFWLYWFVSAFGSKKNSSTSLRQFMGIRIFVIFVAIILFRILNVQNYSSLNHAVTKNRIILALGFIFFLVGLFLAIWARIYLGRNWGFPMSKKQKPELVKSGPYKYIRHPIYSGILLGILSTALVSEPFWFIIFALVGIYFIYSAVMEEKLMMEEFPKEYLSYKTNTKMHIPFVF